MSKTGTTKIENLVSKALEGVRRNLTDHVFWEIQRNTDLFRKYVSILAENSVKDTVYREVHREIAIAVKKATNAKSARPGKTGNSALNQTYTRFDPKTVQL